MNPLKPPDGWKTAYREYTFNRPVTVGLVSSAGVLATFYRVGAEDWYCPAIRFVDGSVLNIDEDFS